MKRFYTAAALIILAVIGAARFVDFVRFTDIETGFFTSGSLTLRYVMLAAGLVICAIPMFFKKANGNSAMFSGGGLWFACFEGIICEIIGFFFVLQAVAENFLLFRLCQGILFVLLGFWCFYSAIYVIRVHEPPAHGSLIAAVGGCALYLTVLERFLVFPSSLHRMWPVLDILSIISSLLLFASIYKAVYTKTEARPYKRITVLGLSTFFLSACVQAPCAIYLLTQRVIHINDFIISVVLALFGIIGAVAAQQAVAD